MSQRSFVAALALTLLVNLPSLAASPTASAPAESTGGSASAEAFTEARKMLGTVPSMLTLIPEASVPGAWAQIRDFQIGKTKLSGKTKELIGIAVASQIPCRYCVYFHSRVGMELNGMTETEKKEAIAIAALTRQWSTLLNGIGQDERAFRRDLERMQRANVRQTQAANRSDSTSGATSSAANTPGTSSMSMAMAKTADDVYREAKKMWGFVPEFISKLPKEAAPGAWNHYSAIMMDPSSMIPVKDRALISLAVASQVPCSYCVTMVKMDAKHNGATEAETMEAITMAAQTRHWSTVLNGNMLDEKAFRTETDGIVAFVKKQSASASSQSSTDSPLDSSTDTTSGTTSPPIDERPTTELDSE